MVDISSQTTASLTVSSVEELLKLSNEFGKKLSDLSGSLWLWRIATVTTLALGILTSIAAVTSSHEDERSFAVLVAIVSSLLFIYSVIRWSSISGQISHVSFLHQRAIELIGFPS
ncbi:hypothetical protein [Simkania negevensis]|uniref:Uncharacterized protein n=1 Tax=Simkania negevensis (strain ATCC VR-1471 / DSM 27360 / Z) TaxID=331113 RepID=F8L836_SIMNZ|nr:hypothetical protein [Simkania negevensis]MCB1066579.1 hypothetical protein [Simkania sp.]MCB1074619.1 hypothetical protein [Simkania sp.]MCP5490478.1 hypothetical protein [Chlamydiales bacterium]CCB88941.1 unknown protein [Simkania negevensis Z]